MGSSDHKTLKEVAKDTLAKNPTALGDPVSLKAEKSDTQPTEKDKPNKSAEAEAERKRTGGTSEGKKSLAEAAMSNPTLLGDPVSLKAERSDSQITPDDRGARGVDKVARLSFMNSMALRLDRSNLKGLLYKRYTEPIRVDPSAYKKSFEKLLSFYGLDGMNVYLSTEPPMSDDGVEVHSLRGELGISSNENLDSSTAPIYHDAPEVSPASTTSDRPLPQPKKPSKFGLSRFMMKQKKATGITQEATETGDPATTRPAVPRKSSQLLNKLYKDKPYPEVTAQQWLESLEKSVAPQLHAPKPRRTMQNWFDSNTDEELESCQLPANVERSIYRSPIMNETTLPGLPRDHEASEDESFLSELRRLEIQTQAKRKAILSSPLGPQTKSQGLFDSRVLKASASQQSPPSAVNRPSQLTGLGLIPNPFEADSSGLSTPTSMLERAAASSMIVVDRAQLGRIQTPGSARAIFDMVRPEELVKSNDPDPPERKVYRLGNVVASQNTRQPSPLTVDLGGSLRGSWISDSAFTDSSSEEIFTKPNVTTPPEPTPTPTPKKPSYAKSKWRQSRHIMTVTREEAALILDLRRRRAAGQKDATLSGIGSIENGWPWAESLKKPRSKRSTGKSPRGPRMGLSVSSRPRKVVHLKPHTTMAYYQSDERFTATSSPLAASRTAELEASSPVSSVPPTPAVPTSYMDTAVATPRQFAPYTRQRNSTACPYKLLTEVDISRLRMSVMLLKSDRFEEIPKRYGVDVHLPEAGEQGVDTRVTTAQSAGAQGMTVPVTTTQEATTQSTATQGASTHGATAPSVASPKVDNWQPWREELRLVTAELEA